MINHGSKVQDVLTRNKRIDKEGGSVQVISNLPGGFNFHCFVRLIRFTHREERRFRKLNCSCRHWT